MWESTILVVVDPAAESHQPALERVAWPAKQAGGRLELFACEWDPDIDSGRGDSKVRDRVLDRTGKAQEPFFYGSLGSEQLYFKLAGAQ